MEERVDDLLIKALLKEEQRGRPDMEMNVHDACLTAYNVLRHYPCMCLIGTDELCPRCDALEKLRVVLSIDEEG